MVAGAELERLLAAVVGVYTQGETEVEVGDCAPSTTWPPLEGRNGELFSTYMRALRRIIATVKSSSALPDPSRTVLDGAIGGVEWVLREEILSGRTAELPSMLPSFTYLISQPFLPREEGLRHSERVRELLEARGYSPR